MWIWKSSGKFCISQLQRLFAHTRLTLSFLSLRVALLGNPQGNADEQTPIVLVRHDVGRRDEILKGALDDEVARKKRAKRGVGFKQK